MHTQNMLRERINTALNLAIWGDRNPDPDIHIGNKHPEILVPVITPQTIKDFMIMFGTFTKGAGAFTVAVGGYDFFKAGEALSQQDQAQAFAWATKGFLGTGVGAGLIGGAHWFQTKLAPAQDFIHIKTNSREYHYLDYFYSGYISQDKQFAENELVRKFIPRFIRNRRDRTEVKNSLEGMQVFNPEIHGFHSRGRN